jgi:hypothetical protein
MNIFLLLPALGLMSLLTLISCSKKVVDGEQPVQVDSVSDRVEQPVSVAPEGDKQVTKLDSIVIPSRYQITIQGKTEAGDFSEIEAVLEVTLSQEPDPNPILVAIYPADPSPANLAMGHLFWQSYSPGLPTADEHFSRVTVDGGRVRMEVNPSDQLRSDVMWFTEVTGTLAEIPGMPEQSGRMGATAQTGTLTFQVEGSEISGEISLSGTSDMGTPSTYMATFSGRAL